MTARIVLLVCFPLLMLACTDAPDTAAPATPDAQPEAAASVTYEGIDVSHYQGDVDWGRVKAAGKTFAIAKATEGRSYVDPMFATNWTGIKAAGLVRGAYHFFEPEENGVDQAQHFIDTVTLAPGDLPPMLDIEVADGETPERIATEIRVWLEAVKAHYGVTPIVYSDVSFIREDLANGFESYPLWLAEYHDGAAPNVPAPWTTWTLWQYTSKGQVDGVDGDVDQDRFVGAEAAWRTLLVK